MTYWIQTQRGRSVDLLNPSADDIDPAELASLLSRLNRFGGHTRPELPPITVAQHSWFVSWLIPSGNIDLKLAGLLHDGPEGYMGADITRPLKGLLNSYKLRLVEHAWEHAIAERFGFDGLLFGHPEVKHADNVALATERRDLMLPCDREWAALPEPSTTTIDPWSPEKAASVFATTLATLLRLKAEQDAAVASLSA